MVDAKGFRVTPSWKHFDVILIGARLILRSESVKDKWYVKGDKAGQQVQAWLGDGIIIARRPKGGKGTFARIHILQKDCSEGDGAPRFTVEWKTEPCAKMKRLTRNSPEKLLQEFSKNLKSGSDIFWLGEIIFGNHWSSDILCGFGLIPQVLHRSNHDYDLLNTVSCALAEQKNNLRNDIDSIRMRSIFLAKKSLASENFFIDVASLSKCDRNMCEKVF